MAPAPIEEFLAPLRMDVDKAHALSRRFLHTFKHLAAESKNQFLPTPISESILRPVGDRDQGCHLAIDIGGTNLRVGFVEVRSRVTVGAQTDGAGTEASSRRVRRLLEKSWPIDDHLKNENSDGLFLWIGKCIAEVVQEGCQTLPLSRKHAIPLGVTFSFPMVQHSLSEATLMSMGKGFALTADTNLGSRLMEGYGRAKKASLPDIRVDAIANDSVSTLVSFIYKYNESETRRATMGLILGTGCNATIPLKLSQLHQSKHPQAVTVPPGERIEDVRITVNTELSINGTAPPLRELDLVSRWDRKLDAQNETPGFQPLEYMTAGRYLGELGRILLVDYLTSHLGIARQRLPAKVLQRHSLTTTFLSHFKPGPPSSHARQAVAAAAAAAPLVGRLNDEFPTDNAFAWTEEMALALYRIAKAIEVRAAGIVAAATLALLTLAGEIPSEGRGAGPGRRELGVGYTGGCIVHFQDYLGDCQKFLDQLLERRYGRDSGISVILSPCHDGGITGAGILVAAASSSVERADA